MIYVRHFKTKEGRQDSGGRSQNAVDRSQSSANRAGGTIQQTVDRKQVAARALARPSKLGKKTVGSQAKLERHRPEQY